MIEQQEIKYMLDKWQVMATFASVDTDSLSTSLQSLKKKNPLISVHADNALRDITAS
jgi:hypothetical protein